MKGIYIIKFFIATIILMIFTFALNVKGALIYAIYIPIFALIGAIPSMYLTTLKKRRLLFELKENQNLPFIQGRFFSYFFIIIISIYSAFIIPVKFYIISFNDLVALLFLPFIYIFIFYFINRKSKKIIKEEFIKYRTIQITNVLSSIIASIFFVIVIYLLKDIELIKRSVPDLQNNPIAYAISEIIYMENKITNSIFNASGKSIIVAIILFFSNSILFYFLINYFSFFFLKKDEIYSVFRPINNNPIKKFNKFIYFFMASLFLLFIYPPLFAFLQTTVQNHYYLINKAKEITQVAVELIDGATYKKGTIDKIKQEKEKLSGKSIEELNNSINATFDNMISNVDNYLDWYYSLSAEYSRIIKLLSGSLDDYMKNKLQEFITPKNDDLSSSIDNINQEIDKFNKKIAEILLNNKVEYENGTYYIINDVNLNEIYESAEITGILDLQKRLGITASGSIAIGAITGSVASKIAAKTTFKTATKAVGKVAIQKGLSAGIGIAAGVISSFFATPIAGVAIGTATGVAIDKGLLSLEEMVARQDYKNEIILSLNESRNEYLNLINNSFK